MSVYQTEKSLVWYTDKVRSGAEWGGAVGTAYGETDGPSHTLLTMAPPESANDECYRRVPGWPGYWASSHGRVWSDKTNRFLRPRTTRQGYKQVVLSDHGKVRTRSLHSLVMKAFVGPRPDGFHINHIDGKPANNRLGNLEYVSPSENAKHAMEIGLFTRVGSAAPQTKLTEEQVMEIRRRYADGGVTQRELGEEYGVSASNIGVIVRRQSWTHLP